MWKCPKCETLNDESGAFCFICNESKPVYQPPVSRPAVYSENSGYGGEETNNGWIIGLAIGVSVFITLIILIALF